MEALLSLEKVELKDRDNYKRYLLLADEDPAMVDRYLYTGELFAIRKRKAVIGAILIIFPSKTTIEIKNIALEPQARGLGYGKKAIQLVCDQFYLRNFKKIIVGTANSSIGNLAFYQKMDFRITEIRKDFFLQYEHPIIENGIRALDMIMMEKNIK